MDSEMAKISCTLEGCRDPDDSLMVACESCSKWWHYACAKFDPSKYDSKIPWFCSDNCRKSSNNEVQTVGKADDSPNYDNSLTILMEAAVVAQAAVVERDEEILLLRKEMENIKLELVKASAIRRSSLNEEMPRCSTPKNDDDKLQLLRRIQDNHKNLLEGMAQRKVTPPIQGESPRDSSIQNGDMTTLLTILNRQNVQELPPFSGEDLREWPYFEEVFKSTTLEGRFSNKENVSRLRKALKGEAYQMVSDRLKYSSDADAVMNSLRAVFGRHDVLVHDLTADLLNLPTITSKCDPKLRLWAVKLNGFVADIKSLKREADLNNSYVLTSLSCKLGSGLYQDWTKKKLGLRAANFQDFAEFLTEKVIELPPVLSKQIPSLDLKKTQKPQKTSGRVLTHNPISQAQPTTSCLKCGRETHSLDHCWQFKSMPVEERLAFAKDNKVCFSCLHPSKHDWKTCKRSLVCGIDGCGKRHHPLLHLIKTERSSNLNSAAASFSPVSHVHTSHVSSTSPILFKIVPVRVYGKARKFLDTFAFLDDGSSLSMIEKEVFDELGLEGTSEKLTLQWTKGVSRQEDSIRTTLPVSGASYRKQYLLKNVYTVKNLELPCQSINVIELQKAYPHLRGLPLTDLANAKPKLLVGLDQAKFLWGRGQRHGNDDEPCAIKTLLGWTVYGCTAPSLQFSSLQNIAKPAMHFMFHDAIKPEEELHDLVRHHFTTEDFGVMAPKGDLVGKEVSRAISIMESTLKKVDHRYEIGLLWARDDIKLPNSYPMALKRLLGLEKILKRNPDLLDWKNKHMREMLSKGYARIASAEELKMDWPRVWYAPTFIVTNPNKFPPKPRDVADVAAKVGGVSLNSFLLKGPDNLIPLHAGLFKFRERAIAVNADVKEMFHRILIRREDQQCQRILWRDGDSSKPPTVYIMQVMMFGPRCSPTCAQFVKNTHAELFRDKHPEAVDGLTKRTYVDDYFNSHDSIEKALNVTQDAIHICKSMNFDLVNVQSNARSLLQQIPDTNVNSKLISINPNECDSVVAKVLGMYWNPSTDFFIYKLTSDESIESMLLFETKITKRNMLRTIMRIFDPLGLVSFFIVRGRIVLQEVWREGFNWDEEVSQNLKYSWLEFLRELKHIGNIKISRRYLSWSPDESKTTLIIFVDASEKAFAAIAFLRFENNGVVEVAQVMAKAKVAPVKSLSIPRLELQAAVLGSRLATTIKKSHSIKIDETIFLSDSNTVLSWIHSTKFKFPAFVTARVSEILETTYPRQWFHVPSKENVADDATKWTDASIGDSLTRWFLGPDFLRLSIQSWPIQSWKSTDIHYNENADSQPCLIHNKKKLYSFAVFEEIKPRFRARWTSAVRVIAFILRFVDIIRKKETEKEPFTTPSEFERAENWLFRKIQLDSFPADFEALSMDGQVKHSSSILCLTPFLDKENTIRLSSRAQKAVMSYAARNPAILPKSHALVDLLIEHHHAKNNHIGIASVISDIRAKAWIISIRNAVEKVRSKCYMCKRLKAKPVMPIMGQLPEARLAFNLKPFTHVGVDCFGPMLVKHGRGTVKRYGMIFTCLTFRAIQIELLSDLSLDQCIMALRRFIINRVVTRFLYSDNGLNFIGANNQMQKDIKEMELALSEYAAKFEGIRWRFIPAYSPWMGGAWERLIQSIKKSVEFVLKGIVPQEDVLRNALLEAQGQINRRPLTHIPVDPEDPKPLTPNLMLFGPDDKDITAPGVFSENDLYSRMYNRRSQHLMSELTKRWYREYLPEITRRSKWHQKTKAVEVGNIVLLIEPNEIRNTWQFGRVNKVYPGPDGEVRIADVRLSDGTIKARRSVGRLTVLDVESSS